MNTTKRSKTKDYGRFDILSEDDMLSIIAASQGLGGGGKTHFWLTAPDPIAYFLFEPGGLKGLRQNKLFRDRFEDGRIRVIDYSREFNVGKMPADERVEKALEVLEQFQKDWDDAIGFARTLVWDKEEYVWEMVRYAHDEVNSPQPKNFHQLNLMMHGWVSDAEKNGKNFGLIRSMSDSWGKTGGINKNTGQPAMGFTGIYKANGHKKIPDLVQINMEHRWDSDAREFKVKILEKCRLGEAERLMGKEFGDMDFQQLAQVLYPDTSPEEWGLDE